MPLIATLWNYIIRKPSPAFLPPEPKPEKLLWRFDEKGLPEGIYNLCYQNDLIGENYLGTHIMVAISAFGERTEVVHLEYKTRNLMLARRSRTRYLSLPIDEATPEMANEAFPLLEKPNTGLLLVDNIRPGLFYSAGLEVMAWDKQDFDA